MHPKKLKCTVDTANKNNGKTILAGVLSGLFGLLLVMSVSDIRWLNAVGIKTLIPAAAAVLLLGVPAHELYHIATARLLGYSATGKWLPIPVIRIEGTLTKWGAVGIKMAPLMDLTLISALILAFFPSALDPALAIFLVGNMAGSGSDIVQSYYIFKLADSHSLIQFTWDGFEILE